MVKLTEPKTSSINLAAYFAVLPAKYLYSDPLPCLDSARLDNRADL